MPEVALKNEGEICNLNSCISETQQSIKARALDRLQTLSDPTCEKILSRVVRNLRKETTYLQELEDTGIANALEHGLKNSRFGAFVFYLPTDTPMGRILSGNGKVSGAYIPPFDSALIFDKPPAPREMLKSLVEHGVLPEVIGILDKELTHDLQITNSQRLLLWAPLLLRSLGALIIFRIFGVVPGIGFNVFSTPSVLPFKNSIFGSNILHEVQAMDAAVCSPTFEPSDESLQPWTTNKLVSSLKLKGERHQMVAEAFYLVHNLRLLGVDDKKIAYAISSCGYDKHLMTYPKLSLLLKQKRSDLGLSDDLDFAEAIQTLERQLDFDIRSGREIASEYAIREINSHIY